MDRRSFLVGAAASSALISHSTRAQNSKSVLKFVPQSDLTIVDPFFTTASVTRNHGLLIWDQLYGLDADLRPQPQMVLRHRVEDAGLRWIFTLRSGQTFHDGQPVRGRDCIASIKRWAQRSSEGGSMLSVVSGMSSPTDDEFVIDFKTPYPHVLSALARVSPPALLIMPERIANTPATQQINELVGSGPFVWKADERVVGAKAVYERYQNYQARSEAPSFASGSKKANVDRIEWHIMPDPATALAALQANEIDWWEEPPNDLLPAIAGNPAVKTRRSTNLGRLGTGVFNHLHAPFNNPAVRRVVLKAFSQSDCMAAVAGEQDQWRTGVGVFPIGAPMSRDLGVLPEGKRDFAALKKELAAAGYRGERVVLLAASDNSALAALGEVANDVLRKLGMNVDYVVSDWGTLVQRRSNRGTVENNGWSMFHTTWDGMDLLNPLVSQMLKASGDQTYFGWPNLPELEALRMQWVNAGSEEEQKRLAAEIQKMAMDQALYIPTGQYYSKTAYSSKIDGIPQDIFAFWSLRKS